MDTILVYKITFIPILRHNRVHLMFVRKTKENRYTQMTNTHLRKQVHLQTQVFKLHRTGLLPTLVYFQLTYYINYQRSINKFSEKYQLFPI